jgi:hypothetical protein
MSASSPATPVATSDPSDNAPEYVPGNEVTEESSPSETPATETPAETTEDKVTPSVKFPEVSRLFSVADIAKLAGIAGQTVATYVMTSVAPAPDYLVGERMVWVSLAPWQEWLDTRAWLAAEKAFQRQQEESAAFAKIASKIADHTDSVPSETRAALLAALLAQTSAEDLEALGILKA